MYAIGQHAGGVTHYYITPTHRLLMHYWHEKEIQRPRGELLWFCDRDSSLYNIIMTS